MTERSLFPTVTVQRKKVLNRTQTNNTSKSMFNLLQNASHPVLPNNLTGCFVPSGHDPGPEYQVHSSLDSLWRVIIAPYK